MTRQDGKEISLKGIVASHGLAIGPAYIFKPSDLSIPPRDQESLEQELNRFEVAIKQARMELIELRNLLNQRAGQEQSDIISAHLSMLDDPHLAQMVREGVKSGKIIELAVQQAIEELAGILTSMSDPLFAERSLDVQDVGDRILRILLGVSDSSLNNLKVPSIIIAEDLSPSDTARLDPQFTLGFCTSSGGLT
ncbi:MAG: phosphoenolpyruvate-utilizing N-terminal domain-containing protein, partial [Chloroflexota bacterium]